MNKLFNLLIRRKFNKLVTIDNLLDLARKGISKPEDVIFFRIIDVSHHLLKGFQKTIIPGRGDFNEIINVVSAFEVSCYLLFRIDIHLFRHHPNHRENITTFLYSKFIELFEPIFNNLKRNRDEIHAPLEDIIYSRIFLYGDASNHSKEPITSFHELLIILITKTVSNEKPSLCRQIDIVKSFTRIDLSKRTLLSVSLISLEKYLIPPLMDVVNECLQLE